MGKLVFGMMQSLDGYVDGVAGKLELPPPDAALGAARLRRPAPWSCHMEWATTTPGFTPNAGALGINRDVWKLPGR